MGFLANQQSNEVRVCPLLQKLTSGKGDVRRTGAGDAWPCRLDEVGVVDLQ